MKNKYFLQNESRLKLDVNFIEYHVNIIREITDIFRYF